MARCPVCDKLTPIVPAPRDALDRPRKRVVDHGTYELNAPIRGRCAGSRALV